MDHFEAYNAGYEQSGCPACGDPACTFPIECQAAVGPSPARGYPHHDTDED